MPEAYKAPLEFLLIFALNAAGAFLLTRAIRAGSGRAARAMSAVVFSVCQIILITCVLGFAGHLGYGELLACQAAVCVIAGLYFIARRGAGRGDETAPAGGTRFSGPWELGLLGLIILFGFYVFLWAIVSPPPSSDSFLYHLALPVKWIQTGSFSPDQTWPFGLVHHPSNPETVLLWLMLPFREDMLANLVSAVFWMMSAVGVYALGCRLGAGRAAALAGAAVWMLLPLSSRMASSSEVDHFAAFFFLAALVFLLDFRDSGRDADLVAGGLALGVYLGSKLIALAFYAPVVLLMLWAVLARREKIFRRFVLVGVAVLLPSLVWFVLNYRLTGNPVYPINLPFPGDAAFGPVNREYIMSRAAAPEPADFIPVLKALAGVYMSAVLGAGLLAAIAGKISAGRFLRAGVPVVPLLLFVLFYLIGSMNQENSERYLLPALAVACAAWAAVVPRGKVGGGLFYVVSALCLGEALSQSPFTWKMVSHVNAALAGRSTMSELEPVARAVGVALMAPAVAAFAFLVSGNIRVRRVAAAAAVLCAALSLVFLYPGFSKYYRDTKYHWYRATNPGLGDAWLAAANIYPKPLNVGVAGTNLYHGFNGPEFSNRVFNLNYGGRRYRRNVSLVDELFKYDIQVFAYQLPRVRRGNDSLEGARPEPIFWIIAEHPEIFRPAAVFGDVHLYVINAPGRDMKMETGALEDFAPRNTPRNPPEE